VHLYPSGQPSSRQAGSRPRSGALTHRPRLDAISAAGAADAGTSAEADAAVALWKQGRQPVPLQPIGARSDLGRAASDGKNPIGEHWGQAEYASEHELRQIYRRNPGAGVGLAMGLLRGGKAGLVDLEVDEPKSAAASLKAIFGDAGTPRTVGWRSARGEHRIYLLELGDAKRLLAAGITQSVLSGTNYPCLQGLELRLGTLDPQHPKYVQSVVPPTVTRNPDGTLSKPRRYIDHDAGCARLPAKLIDYLIENIGSRPKAVTKRVFPNRTGLLGLSPIEKFKAQLTKLEIPWSQCGEGCACKCPAHRGGRENLTFNEGDDGKLLVYCHHGCSFEDIIEAVNLTPWNACYSGPEVSHTTKRTGVSNIECEDHEISQERIAKITFQYEKALEAMEANPKNPQKLAGILGVSVESLERIGVGWREDREPVDGEWVGTGRWAWIFPEVNGDEEIVGLLRRYENSEVGQDKKLIAHGRRGLTVPNRWKEGTDVLFLVEGASDVAAMLTMERMAIGRPQASSPRVLGDLVKLLKDDEREIIVVKDNDEVGHKGAEQLAAGLARLLARKIPCIVPPRNCKDMREYLIKITSMKKSGSAP
jgi:hypothetical protein